MRQQESDLERVIEAKSDVLFGKSTEKLDLSKIELGPEKAPEPHEEDKQLRHHPQLPTIFERRLRSHTTVSHFLHLIF